MLVGVAGLYTTSYTFPSTMRTQPINNGGGSAYTLGFLNSFGVAHSQTTQNSQAFTFSAYIP
jgi:hypothetical protein